MGVDLRCLLHCLEENSEGGEYLTVAGLDEHDLEAEAGHQTLENGLCSTESPWLTSKEVFNVSSHKEFPREKEDELEKHGPEAVAEGDVDEEGQRQIAHSQEQPESVPRAHVGHLKDRPLFLCVEATSGPA